LSGEPGLDIVAVLTFKPEETCMNYRLGVTTRAGSWCARKYFVHVTALASNGCMPSFQRKKCIVVECNHAVSAIMTVLTNSTEYLYVFNQEGGTSIDSGMAVNTYLRVKICKLENMAISTVYGLIFKIPIVKRQAEAGACSMLKSGSRKERW